MEKKEYLVGRLRNDFIRYVLLKEPRYSDEEISRKLKDKIDAELLYQKIKVHIPALIDKYLSPEKLKDKNGKFVDELPQWLTPQIAEQVVAEYRAIISREYSALNFLPDILAHIERLTWAQGVDDMAVNLRRFVSDLRAMAAHYHTFTPCSPEHYEIEPKYEAAKRITIGEHVMRNNDRDIADFLAAMRAYCSDLCLMHISIMLSKLYADLAASPAILGLIDKFTHLHHEAEAALQTLPAEAPAEWSEEYNRLIPIPFFEQNIEDIAPAAAFQTILLTTLAHHESLLRRENGLSDKGELTIFTSSFPLLTTSLFNTIVN